MAIGFDLVWRTFCGQHMDSRPSRSSNHSWGIGHTPTWPRRSYGTVFDDCALVLVGSSLSVRRRPQLAYSVEKLRITIIRKFKGIFQSPGAQVTDQSCRSELRQAGFSYDFCYPLVTTVHNAAQIANEIVAHFKTEFFNRIGQKRTFVDLKMGAIGSSVVTEPHGCLVFHEQRLGDVH